MLNQYLIFLGREPELAVAELAAVALRDRMEFDLQVVTSTYAIIQGVLPVSIVHTLAGTVKVAEVVGKCAAKADALTGLLQQILVARESERVEFGLSWYGERHAPRWFANVGLSLKRELKGQGHVRYVVSREAALSSVVVAKNHLLPPSGFEFVVLPQGEELLVGRTLEVQDFEDWSKRDYGRPGRDARVGMLPPKLARLMVNLAGAPRVGALLDPFCGSGTVLQEAALLGYTDLVGADSDSRGLDRTRQNWAWLQEHYPQLGTVAPALYGTDIQHLASQLGSKKFSAIITEPYLGPPLTGREDEARLGQIRNQLAELYRVSLKVMASLLNPSGRIVMVWPSLRRSAREYPLELGGALAAAHLRLVNTLPAAASSAWRTPRGTLRYERPDQRVVREIAVLGSVTS